MKMGIKIFHLGEEKGKRIKLRDIVNENKVGKYVMKLSQ